MSKEPIFLADPPTKGYLITMACIALAGTLGLPFMIWLIFTSIYKHQWALVVGALVSGLLCAGMLQSWKSLRNAVRMQKDPSRHSVSVAGQKLTYRKEELVQEIPLGDVLSITDQAEPSIGSQAWSVRIAYRKAEQAQSELVINAMDFTKVWEKQGKFGALISEALRAHKV